MTATTPAADAGRDVEAEGFRARGQFRRGLRFLKRQLRMLMKIDASASMSG